jgi:cytochrome bd-type quinol oxidase subunit 2
LRVLANIAIFAPIKGVGAAQTVEEVKMTYRRALKVALIPWLILVASLVAWIAFGLKPAAREILDVSWRMGVALVVAYFGLAFTIFRIREISDQTKSFRR